MVLARSGERSDPGSRPAVSGRSRPREQHVWACETSAPLSHLTQELGSAGDGRGPQRWPGAEPLSTWEQGPASCRRYGGRSRAFFGRVTCSAPHWRRSPRVGVGGCGRGVGWMGKRRDTGRSFRQLIRQVGQQATRAEAEARDRHTSALMDGGVSPQRRASSVSPGSPRLRGGGLEVGASDALVSSGTLHQGHRLCLLWTRPPGPSAPPHLPLGKGRTPCHYTARDLPGRPQMLNWLISVEIFLQAGMTRALNQFEIHCLQIHKERVRGGRAPIILISQGGRTGCDGLGLLWGEAGPHYGEGVRGSRPRREARC